MKTKRLTRELDEYHNFTLPASLTAMTVLVSFFVAVLTYAGLSADVRSALIAIILLTISYVLVAAMILTRGFLNHLQFDWFNSVVTGLGLWWLGMTLPEDLYFFHNLLVVLATVSISIYSGRVPAAIMIFLAIGPHLILHAGELNGVTAWGRHFGVVISAVVINAFVTRLKEISLEQIDRLEIINRFSRQVAATLDREKIIGLLDQTLPEAMNTDSYLLGIREGDQIHVPLFFDDGRYYNNERMNMHGTLSGWVIEHQKELFLPDLRRPTNIEGIDVVVGGSEKLSLSWMGVPLTSTKFKGLIVLASYQPNAFNRGDMELLANLAQHTALALENAAVHADAQERSRLDSLTGVYNHGYFLELLENHVAQSMKAGLLFSVIMLDVDHFKQYNDIHGHLLGDEILNRLCNAIRAHIKNTDAVGRWGGEEFVICLPNTDREQALLIAHRIRKSMSGTVVIASNGTKIEAPTISQGIAQFPNEADEAFQLIDLADKRLYIAKRRGRDQIEPAG